MTLADEIEAGGGTNEAVARALGRWTDADDAKWYEPPAFLDDIRASMAECERRGWAWFWNGCYRVAKVWSGRLTPSDGEHPEPARALCAALVRAVEAGDA